MAIMLESMTASAVTLSNCRLGAGFLAQWAMAIPKSLPVVLIGLYLALLIKLRLDRSVVTGTPGCSARRYGV
jgi:hypothetical protein